MAKILVVASPPGPLTLERAVAGHCAGHEIFWLSTPKVDLPHVTSLGPPTKAGRFGRTFLEPIILIEAIRRIQPDLIHVHFAWQGLRTPILLRYRPLIVSTMGGDILPDQGYNGLRIPFTRALLNHADYITSKSTYLDTALCRIGDYQHKIRRVTWGIDLNRFHPNRDTTHLRAQWNIPPNDLVFFDARGAKSLYNKHVIMTAFADYLRSGGPSATLLVAEFSADSTYVDQLKRQAQASGIADQIRFVGSLDYAIIPDYYALADVTISVPRSDGLPQTIYEALACGSFLILSDLPQYAGTVENDITARLVPVDDSEAIARALTWIALRPDARTRAAQLGRAYVQQQADQSAQRQLVNQLYGELLTTYNH